jgi:hypothetical protein
LDSLRFVLHASSAILTHLSTTPVEDGNRVSTMAVEGTIDHASGPHQIHLGLEAGVLSSRFHLRSVYITISTIEGVVVYADPEIFVTEGRSGKLDDAVRNATDSRYVASYAEDRWQLSREFTAEAGVRITYLPARQTVYGEPRLSLRVDIGRSPIGPWSSRTSAGLYRQFLNQTDVSVLNAGSILPATRVWLPVDASVRPPMAYHLAQELLFTPAATWMLRLDGYLKYEPHGLALNYAPGGGPDIERGTVRQSDILASTKAQTYGGTVTLAWHPSRVRAEVEYAFEHARREGAMLFGGRRHPVPWTEPHRLEVALDWMPSPRLTAGIRWKGVWERPWGFRRTYYDYFGHDPDTRYHTPFDLGDPGAHILPPLYQLDLSAAYTQPIGAAAVQFRAEVINVLNRENVLDWRLVRDGDRWARHARTLYPRIPALAVRVSF